MVNHIGKKTCLFNFGTMEPYMHVLAPDALHAADASFCHLLLVPIEIQSSSSLESFGKCGQPPANIVLIRSKAAPVRSKYRNKRFLYLLQNASMIPSLCISLKTSGRGRYTFNDEPRLCFQIKIKCYLGNCHLKNVILYDRS